MQREYLQRVLIYLQQELPAYKEMLRLNKEQFIFSVPDVTGFQPFYEKLFAEVNTCIGRVRNREVDLDFKVWSKYQERDFTILK